VRTIPDFPEKGIVFRDITTVLNDPAALRFAVDEMTRKLDGLDFDAVAGPESRGFIFGMPIAYNLGKAFIPIRKEGKLPHRTLKKSYALEYGEAVVEMHEDAVTPGRKVVVVDDLLATGGTCGAILELLKEAGGVIAAVVFLIELDALNGRDALKGYNVQSVLTY
jgi:adenine phosphoribosyltransferase